MIYKNSSLSTSERTGLVSLVCQVNARGVLGPPIKQPAAAIGNGEYTSWDVLRTEDNQPADWATGQSMVDILRSNFFILSESHIDIFFGIGRPGVRHRALVALKGGCINIKTMKICRVAKKMTANLFGCLLLR